MRHVLAILTLIVTVVVLAGAPVTFVVLLARDTHNACVEQRRLYDAQISFATFLGHELGASPARIDAAVGRLRAELGPRPKC